LEGLSLIGRLEAIREVLAWTEIGSLPNDYPTEKLAHDRMEEIARLKAEVEELKDGIAHLQEIVNSDTSEEERIRAENVSFKAEVERKDAALRYYAEPHKWPNDGPWGANSNDWGKVARAALTPAQEKTNDA
jgi:hypothetical protein